MLVGFNPNNCYTVLQTLFDISKANVKSQVYSHVLASKTNFNVETLMDCVDYLESKGYLTLLRPKPSGVDFELISITLDGIDRIEKQGQDKQLTKTYMDLNQQDVKQRIFICYAKEDFCYANDLYADLKNAGLYPWLDKKNILPGQNWEKEIKKAIKNSHFFLPLFSLTSVAKRGYVQREFKMGIDVAKEIPEGEIFMIPLRIDDCQIPFDELSSIQYQDLYPDWGKSVEKVIESIKLSMSQLSLSVKDDTTSESTTSVNNEIIELEKSILSESSLSQIIGRILSMSKGINLKPIDEVWLRNELYGYSFTDRGNKNTIVNDNEILPGEPNYRKIKDKFRVLYGTDFGPGKYAETDFPLFLTQPISELENLVKNISTNEVVITIPIDSLPKEQSSVVKSVKPYESEMPLVVNMFDIQKCINNLRLKIHKFVSDLNR